MILYIDKQFNKSVPTEKRKNCEKKILALLNAVESGEENSFLNKNNAKQMQGAKYIWKFRATESDRILYVHTKDVKQFEGIIEEDAILILRYVNHDEQGTVASNLNINALSGDNIQRYQTDFLFTDDTSADQAQDYFRKMQVNRISDYQLSQYIDRFDENYDVMLSQEQAEILNRWEYPHILYGCAGSGKTILSAHIIYNFLKVFPEHKVLYITMSQRLPEQVKKLFRNIQLADMECTDFDSHADFMNIADFMMQKLGKKSSHFVSYEDFHYIFCDLPGEISTSINALRKDDQIETLDLWAEIRGIIKGHLDEFWRWSDPVAAEELSDFQIKYLRESGYIYQTDGSFKYYRISQKYEEKGISQNVARQLREDYKLSDNKKTSIMEACKIIDAHITKFSSEKVALSREEYLKLNSEYSIYPAKTRESIYNIFLKYQSWLEESDYYDDNDLARLYSLYGENHIYDFVAVDEVQDLTEMQIYALTQSCSDSANMVYAGDIHQVVNPTYYSEERIKKLYYMQQAATPVHISFLKKNFRSQDKIVNLANSLSSIRKKRIGSRSLASETSEESSIEGWNPMQLAPDKENLRAMVNTINEIPNTAVIAMDEDSAGKLSQLLEDEDNGNIYTVPEIKGLEKKYIFCYNLVSDCYGAWDDIFSTSNIKKNAKYRYYFNTLYVAVTRAQTTLCFYDDRVPENMQIWINGFIDRIESFSEDRLFLTEDDNAGESWYQSAQKCEEDGDYKRAVAQYKKSGFEDYLYCIDRCRVKKLLASGQVKDAMNFCINRNDARLFSVIADKAKDEHTASVADRIYKYLENDSTDVSPAKLLKDIYEYTDNTEFLNLIADRVTTLTWFRATDLAEKLDKSNEEMRLNK